MNPATDLPADSFDDANALAGGARAATSTSDAAPDIAAKVRAFQRDMRAVHQELSKVIVGQDDCIRQTLACLLIGGHALLEGVPGLGKTLLARTLARVLDLSFSRIQFTPDLMPADIVGTNILVTDAAGGRSMQFQPGPIFGNLVLADEINRATPKTQSALLEAMAEQSVTVGSRTMQLDDPFFVVATQNPLEMEGTYPLPEAQLDRFALKIVLSGPTLDELLTILTRTTGVETAEPACLLDARQIQDARQLVRAVPAASHIMRHIGRLILATHADGADAPPDVKRFVRYGASPRAGQTILLAAKALALLDGRYNVSFEDVAWIAPAALRHRIVLNFEGQAEGISTDAVARAVLGHVPR